MYENRCSNLFYFLYCISSISGSLFENSKGNVFEFDHFKIRTIRETDTKDVVPFKTNFYNLDITIGRLTSPEVSGNVVINFECLVSTNLLTLWGQEMEIDKKKIKLQVDNGLDITSNIKNMKYYRNANDINLKESLIVGKNYSVIFNYKLKGAKAKSFYVKYDDMDGKKKVSRYQAIVPFPNVDVLHAFPIIGSTAKPCIFAISITRPSEMKSLSNMEIKESKPGAKAGMIQDIYETTPLVATNAINFVIHNFAVLSKSTKGGLKVNVYSPLKSIGLQKNAMEYLFKAAQNLETYLDLILPQKKIDNFPVYENFNYAGTANWGITHYRKDWLLFSPTMSFSLKQFALLTLTHETIHQWFGQYVYSSPDDNAWTKEAMPEYLGNYFSIAAEPSFKMDEHFQLKERYDSLVADSDNLSHPLTVERKYQVEGRDYADELIGYWKGANIFRMVNNTMGDENFRKGIHRFLTNNNRKPYTTNLVWNDLSQFTSGTSFEKNNINFINFIESWTLQMGYPILTIARDYKTQRIKLSQKRYIDSMGTESLPDEVYTDKGFKWIIPVELRGPNDKFEFQWLKNTEQTFDNINVDSSKWLIANERQIGFYRVNYDVRNWNLIKEQLCIEPSVFGKITRAGLIDDAFKLADFCYLDINVALSLTQCLHLEMEYMPLKIILENLKKIYLRYLYKDEEIRLKVQKFLLNKLQPLYKKFDWKPMKSNDPQMEFRSLVFDFVCMLNDPDCIDQSRKSFRKYFESQSDTSLRSTVQCTVMRNDHKTPWDDFFDEFGREKNFNSFIYNGLSCSENPENIRKYIDYTLDRNKLDDIGRYLEPMAKNPASNEIFWSMLKDDFNDLIKKSKVINSLPDLVVNVDSLETAPVKVPILLSIVNGPSHFGHSLLIKVDTFNDYDDKVYTNQIKQKKALNVIQANEHWKQCNEQNAVKWFKDI